MSHKIYGWAGIVVLLVCCTPKKRAELVWAKDLYIIGSQSSPRTSDLNGDGILDIVMGAGKNESEACDQGIVALDGKTGGLLWEHASKDQVYGAATFYDINDDQINDIFIGGRSPNFLGLDGRTGNVIWEYTYHHQDDSILKHARFNFNNSILVPDQNNDGLSDLLTVNGGNSLAIPGSEKDRFPGVMILFDSKTGHILAADTMPDGKETYLSPVGFENPETQEFQIIFGTGGETISGHLFMGTLSNLISGKLSESKIIATEISHGFIAPPTLADITGDNVYDIVAISHASSVFAINGKSFGLIWKQKIDSTECSNSMAVGQFTGDDTPDFFTFASKGEWPVNTGSLQIMLDGRDGAITYSNSIGCTGFSSPVVYDLNHDGFDEAIISVNEFDCSIGFVDATIPAIVNKLISIDFQNNKTQTIDQMQGFKNIFTTPWVGDIDADEYLDIVHCQYYSRSGLLVFLGMQVKRIATPVKLKKKPGWGAYMGTNGDGIYNR